MEPSTETAPRRMSSSASRLEQMPQRAIRLAILSPSLLSLRCESCKLIAGFVRGFKNRILVGSAGALSSLDSLSNLPNVLSLCSLLGAAYRSRDSKFLFLPPRPLPDVFDDEFPRFEYLVDDSREDRSDDRPPPSRRLFWLPEVRSPNLAPRLGESLLDPPRGLVAYDLIIRFSWGKRSVVLEKSDCSGEKR